MNCPVCSSEIQAGIKYCPVCGTDVEGAQLRMQQAAARTAPTQRMPQAANVQPRAQVQQPAGSVPANPMVQQGNQNRAVPMNSSMPPQDPGRGFDTSKMGGSPKWPIVLIAVLAVVVVVLAVLLAVRSCTPETTAPATDPANDGNGTPVVAPVTPPASDPSATVGDGGQASTPQQSAGLDNAAAYTELTAAYDQLGAFAERIQAVVDYCNSRDESDAAGLQAEIDSARALQSEIAAQGDSLAAMQLAEGSAYGETLANMKTLNNDLAGRIGDLVDGMQQWANGENPDAFARHNVDGQSTYKTEFETLYPNARPVQA